MAESFRGRGVIAGIAMGRVMMVGKNLDGYLKTYEPGTPEEESEKASAAIAAVAENLQESVKGYAKRVCASSQRSWTHIA